jgi:serine/threonine-protein kinase
VAESPRRSQPDFIGRYRVIDRLGRGAMGVVYSAHDDLMDRDVAVKVMLADLEGEPEIRARFMREAQVSARLTHRNIVTVFDVGEDNGRLFIVMELLRGQTLAECIKRSTLALEEKVDLAIDVCEGLAVANSAGVCHRDIKPGHLFLLQDGGVKILDFGIARLASSSMTASGFIVGTPDYMSPEQARGAAVDERSDIFSLAAVLYLLLSGRKPFEASDMTAVLHKVVSEEEAPPIDPPLAPGALSRIVMRGLAKDPNQRYQRFPELAADLARWRRRYEIETRARADGAARAMEDVLGLAAAGRAAAEALGVAPEADAEAWRAAIAAGYPDVLAGGFDALRSAHRHRRDVEEMAGRIEALRTNWEPRVASIRSAAADLAIGVQLLEAGDARAALATFDRVLRRVPAAPLDALSSRARQLLSEQQARDGKLRSLLAEGADAITANRIDAAYALATQAVDVDAANVEAQLFLARVQQARANAELEKRRQCERSLDRARRALQFEQMAEAEQQLQLAVQTGVAHPDIALVTRAIAEGRAAHDMADQITREIAADLARARIEFQEGHRTAAIARLESTAERHPSSAAVAAEIARLRAEEARLTALQKASDDAERLAEAAAAALGRGQAEEAKRLADEALALTASHELALRTSALANAQIRELAERAARRERAGRLVESARRLLAQGRFDDAIRHAREATELDPLASDAPGLIAEAIQQKAEVAAAEARVRQATERAIELRRLLDDAAQSLRAREFARAKSLAEQALALDPESQDPMELIAKIAAGERLAGTGLDDDTVDLTRDQVDPDATVELPPAGKGFATRWLARVGAIGRTLTARLTSIGRRFARKASRAPAENTGAKAGPGRKEA